MRIGPAGMFRQARGCPCNSPEPCFVASPAAAMIQLRTLFWAQSCLRVGSRRVDLLRGAGTASPCKMLGYDSMATDPAVPVSRQPGSNGWDTPFPISNYLLIYPTTGKLCYARARRPRFTRPAGHPKSRLQVAMMGDDSHLTNPAGVTHNSHPPTNT